jgi:hypothetical protein
MTMKNLKDLIPNIKNCLTNGKYRNILICIVLLIIILICIRLFFFNDKEGFENQIKALVEYEKRNFDRDNIPIWDNRIYLLQPEKVNEQKYSFWNLDKNIYRESDADTEPQKSLGSTINTVSNSQIPEQPSISVIGGKYKVFTDYQNIVTIGDDELGNLKLNYLKFQKSNQNEIKEVLDKVKVSKNSCMNLKKYFESLSNIESGNFNDPLEKFKNKILQNLNITCLVVGNNSDSGSSKSVSLHQIINDSNGVYQAPVNTTHIFHGIPFGVSLSLYSQPNFGGTSKTLFVPYETNQVYTDALNSTYGSTNIRLIDESILENDYDSTINHNPVSVAGDTVHYDTPAGRDVAQSINQDSTTSADTNLTRSYISVVNINPGGVLKTDYKDVAAANRDLGNNLFNEGLSDISFFRPGNTKDDSISSYAYKVGMKLGLINVSITRQSNVMWGVDIKKYDNLKERYDDFRSIYYERLGTDNIGAVDKAYDYFNGIIDDILPSYLNTSGDTNISNNVVRGYLQNVVTNLSHLPENIKIFSDKKPGVPSDIPLVNIRTHYFKTKEMIKLLKTNRDNFVKDQEIIAYNSSMMHINSFLENIYQSENNEADGFTKDILENKIDRTSSFFNFPQLLSFFNEESRGCLNQTRNYAQNGHRGLVGREPSNSLVAGNSYRYSSFSDLDAERVECFKTDELGLFLFTYEIHPSLTPDTICPDVNSFQINAEGYEDKLLKTLKEKIDDEVNDVIKDVKLKSEINDKIMYVNRNLQILNQLESFLEKVYTNQLKFPYLKFVKPIAPSGYVSLGDIAIPSEQSMKTQNRGIDNDGMPQDYLSRFQYLFGGNRYSQDYVHKHISHYVAVPESCTKIVRGWQMTDKIFEIREDNKLISIFKNPFTNTIYATLDNKLPRDGVRKLVACVKQCNAVDNLIRADQCARDLYRTKKGMEYGYNVSPNFADQEENKYYLGKVKERSQHINSLNTIARKLQIEQDKYNIINQENNRGKLQKYLDIQNKNINILNDKLESDRNKIDLNVHIEPEPINLGKEGDFETDEPTKDTVKQVIKFIQQSSLPKANKQKLVDKVIKYQTMSESKLMSQNEFKLNMEKILEDCPEYDLSGLVKKDIVREVCYGCDI